MPIQGGLLSPQIPMAVKPFAPDIAGSISAGYDMRGKMLEQQQQERSITRENSDRDEIQKYVRDEGGDFHTPEGVEKALADLRGRVSSDTYMKMSAGAQKLKESDLKIKGEIAGLDLTKLQTRAALQEQTLSYLSAPLETYNKTLQEKGAPEALAAFEQTKAQILQQAAQQKSADGQPMYEPGQLQALQSAGPEQLQAMIRSTKYYQQQVKTRLEEAQTQHQLAATEKDLAAAKSYGNAGDWQQYTSGKDVFRYNKKLGVSEKQSGEGWIPITALPADATKLTDVSPGKSGKGGADMDLPPEKYDNLVDSIGQYNITLQAAVSAFGGDKKKLAAEVVSRYPDYNAALFPVRQKLITSFTSGTESKNATAINTAIGHAGTLSELGEALKNKDTQGINKLINYVKTQTGRPEVNNMNMAKLALGDELMRVFRQVGASQQEAEGWKKTLDTAQSPEQISGAVKTASDLLSSRILALNDQWKRGMETKRGFPGLISDKSREFLKGQGLEFPQVPLEGESLLEKRTPAKNPVDANNPGALMPGGRLAQYKTAEEGIKAMDDNLKKYGGQGISTIRGVISKWAPPNDENGTKVNDTEAYIKDVSNRLSVKPDQKLNLNDAMVRHAIGSAIMIHESGSKKVMTEDRKGAASKPETAPTKNAKGWTLHTDAKGNKAYVSPDGKSFEEVK